MMKNQLPSSFSEKNGEITKKVEKCEKCFQTGQVIQTISKIQNFKDILIRSFNCQICDSFQQSLSFLQTKNDFGIQILFIFLNPEDGQRQVIFSGTAQIKIEELDLTIKPATNLEITSVRGLVSIGLDQLRKRESQLKDSFQGFSQLISFIKRAQKVLQGADFPLTIRIRDPSGNSNIRNLNYPLPDKNIQVCYFQRSVQELQKIGFTLEEAQNEVKNIEQKKKGIKLNFNKPFEEKDFMHKQPVFFQVPCHTCLMPGQMKLCQTSVPYFTDLVIMSFSCQYCGAHSVQTKNSGVVHHEALQITLKVDTQKDIKRDLFKSETCKVCIPELDLELDYGTLGGQFTTVQGLLEKIHEHLSDRNSFVDLDNQFSVRMKEFLSDLFQMKEGQKSFTLQLIDPLSRSFLQNPDHPQQDKKVKIVSRKRNQEEEDILGFSWMAV